MSADPAHITPRLSFHRTRHLNAEQLAIGRLEARRLPRGWFSPRRIENEDSVAGFVEHHLLLEQVRGPVIGDFLLCRCGPKFHVTFWEAPVFEGVVFGSSSNEHSLGTAGTVAEAIDMIQRMIAERISSWGLQLAA